MSFLYEKIPSLMTDFTEILLRIADHENWPIAFELVSMLTDISFEINILNPHMIYSADFEAVYYKIIMKVMRTTGFHRVLVRNGSSNNDDHGTTYIEVVDEALWIQIKFSETYCVPSAAKKRVHDRVFPMLEYGLVL